MACGRRRLFLERAVHAAHFFAARQWNSPMAAFRHCSQCWPGDGISQRCGRVVWRISFEPRYFVRTGSDILGCIALSGLAALIAPSITVTTLRYAGFIAARDVTSVWTTWWVSDYAGVLTLTPLFIVIILSWRRRNLVEPIVFPLTTVWLGLSLVASYIVWQNKTLTLNERLRQDTQEIVRQFARNTERVQEQMQAIEGLLLASDDVSRDDFRKFVSRLGKSDKSAASFQWAPRVKLRERSKFETRARQDGAPNFAIFEWTTLHQSFTAESRPEYYPLLFVEPSATKQSDIGLDLASIPETLLVLT